ncbi:MAG TPA: VOC family protein [Bryobacteraceae bacterium]|nr:VOC family protein [Bryobacteraceae bacterium]
MRALALIAVTMLARAADLKVDHITVAVRDLAAAQRAFAEAGIETEFGGKHANGQTQMALSSFPDGSYLEIIAPQPGANVAPHYWSKFMLNDAGPCAWAIASADIAADRERLQKAGVAVRSQRNGRTRPDGVELKWETVDAGPGTPGSFFPFLIHDETPRERRVYPSGKPTTTKISGVRFVVIAVKNLQDAIAQYRAAFHLAEPKMEHNRAWFPGTPVILEAGLADRLKQFGEAPCAFVLASDQAWPGRAETWFSETIHWIDPGGARIGIVHRP